MKRYEIERELKAYDMPKASIKFEYCAPDLIECPFYMDITILEVGNDTYGYWTLYKVSERE